MSPETRISLRVSCETAQKIRALAKARDKSVVGLVREAVGVLQTAHDGTKSGLYLGLTPNRENLQTVLVLP